MAAIANRNRTPSSVVGLVRLYAVLLGILLVVRFAIGDRSPLSFTANAFFLYVFLPLPLVLIASVVTRRGEALVVFAIGASVWVYLWGGLFVPRRGVRAAGPRLVVLAYNALGFNRDTADTIRIIRDSAADIVAIEELNLETAAAFERELATEYPYRSMDPRAGVLGAGLLSKHPLTRGQPVGAALSWMVKPMRVDVNVSGRPMTVVAFHADPGPFNVDRRDAQARTLAELARMRKAPLLLVGDLNATDQNLAYAAIARELRDAWRDAGWGFGHTFPGRPTAAEGGSRPVLFGMPAPMWLVRIDYIFYTPDLVALDARPALSTGRSDHRGVIATVAVR